MKRRILISSALTAGLILTPIAGGASAWAEENPVLISAPTQGGVELTSEQLTREGFPTTVNTAGWGGTGELSATHAPVGVNVTLSGTAPSSAKAGQELTLDRYVPADTKGDGTFVPLKASTTVNKDGSYRLTFALDKVGIYGYRLGFTPPGSDEYDALQFQFETTQGETNGPTHAVAMSRAQLSQAGFTRPANTTGWGGTAQASAYTVKAGKPIVLTGRAPKYVKVGTVMSINQFIPTATNGTGEMQAINGVSTKIRKDRTFKLTFTPYTGTHGYTAGVKGTEEWIGFEFQATAK